MANLVRGLSSSAVGLVRGQSRNVSGYHRSVLRTCSAAPRATVNVASRPQVQQHFQVASVRVSGIALRRRDLSCSSGEGTPDEPSFEKIVKQKNAENPVMVYSKSWCPFCGQVKALFDKLDANITVVELDQIVEEQEVMGALMSLTGQRTVPNVFIGGEHIGGCDDTMALQSQGKLKDMLVAAGAIK